MSGAEAIVLSGFISSIISIINGTKQIYNTATSVQGLPEAFRDVAGRFPIIANILGSAKQRVDEGDVDEDSCERWKYIAEACEEKAKKIDELFHKAIPEDGTSDLKRYYKAVQAYGNGKTVENLMKGLLKDVQLLACESGMKTATKVEQEQLIQAIIAVSAIPSSVPEHEFQTTGFTGDNYIHGQQDNTQGEYIAQRNARQYNSAGGAENFEHKRARDTKNAIKFEGDSNNGVQIGDNSGTVIYNTRDTGLEEEKCLAALFLTDPRDDRETLVHVKGSRVDGTCEWINTNALYDSWFHSHSQLLWISGGPGKGKTMLSIYLAEQLERTANDSQNILFLQYFCDNKDEKRNTAVALLRGLIYQLIQYRPKLFNHILPSFKIQKESLFTASSFETLWRIFEAMIRDPSLSSIYCVLDGLDECEEVLLEVILNKINALFSTKSSEISASHLKLIIVSREYPKFIPDLLSSFPRIRLDPDADREVNDDILQFIDVKVDELSNSSSQKYPESLRLHVKDVFRARAQGTFLWIGLASKALKKYEVTEIETALDLILPGLDELYARLLLQIEVDRREIAAQILRWVVLAVRPLTISELSIAIKIPAGQSIVAFSRNDVMRDQVLRCGYFLTTKKSNKVYEYEDEEVSLIHQSAKDYLLRSIPDANPTLEVFRVKREAGNLEISRKCLDKLQNCSLSYIEVSRRKSTAYSKLFPLVSYAVLYWPEHARSLARSEDIFDLSLHFYHKKSQFLLSWFETYWALKEYGDPPKSFTLLHLVSYFGILPLAENFFLKRGLINKVKRPFYLNKVDGWKRTALSWAAWRGHEAVVRLLLEKGADIEVKDRYSGTALVGAAEGGHEAVVRLLLEKGADIEVKDRYSGTALVRAAEGGHEAVVRLLLEKGADIEAKNEYSGTALVVAARGRHEAVVRLLLEKGADSGTALVVAADRGHEAVIRLMMEKGADSGRALVKAAANGQEAVLRLLLEKGADIEAKSGNSGTALVEAATNGREAVLRLLLEKGADIEAKDKYSRTALVSAAEGGRETVVRLLLEKGADIEVKDRYSGTALVGAAERGHEAVVRLLLEKGADIEAKSEYRGTALFSAAERGHEAVVRLLLEKGADIEAKDKYSRTALVQAAEGGRETVVRLLLENGADIEGKSEYIETALVWAAERGHEAVVRLLLEKGADIEAKSEYRGTALFSAAERGHEAVVRLLLEKGADIEAKDKYSGTALVGAAKGGHEAVVRLLLEKGADIEVKDRYSGTALVGAAKGGHEAVKRLLLEKGGDIEVKSEYSRTALVRTIKSTHKTVVQLLFKKGRTSGSRTIME